MKKDIHPSTNRLVCFKDISNDTTFLMNSSAISTENIEINGKEYPLVKVEISAASHPFFTGVHQLVDTAGRIDKFNKKFAKFDKYTAGKE